MTASAQSEYAAGFAAGSGGISWGHDLIIFFLLAAVGFGAFWAWKHNILPLRSDGAPGNSPRHATEHSPLVDAEHGRQGYGCESGKDAGDPETDAGPERVPDAAGVDAASARAAGLCVGEGTTWVY
eukprot:gene42009-35415_t